MDPQLLIRFPQFDHVFFVFQSPVFQVPAWASHRKNEQTADYWGVQRVFIYTSGGTHINLGNSWCLQMSVQIIFRLTSILFPNSEIKENNN